MLFLFLNYMSCLILLLSNWMRILENWDAYNAILMIWFTYMFGTGEENWVLLKKAELGRMQSLRSVKFLLSFGQWSRYQLNNIRSLPLFKFMSPTVKCLLSHEFWPRFLQKHKLDFGIAYIQKNSNVWYLCT